MTPIDVILEAGCIATGTTPAEMRLRDRRREPTKKRRFIARKMRAEGYSYPAIGRALGGRDHSTIMSLLDATPRIRLKKLWRCR